MNNLNIVFYENHLDKKYIYYTETLKALKKISNKFQLLSNLDNLKDDLKKVRFKPDILILGYGATDTNSKNLPDLSTIKIPKAIYLNKEYQNLEYKLDWIKNQKFVAGFTVLNKTKEFRKISNTKFFRINFAVNPKKFKKPLVPHDYNLDISFSGVIRTEQANDIRREVMNELFRDSYWYDKRISFTSHLNDSEKSYYKKLIKSKVTFSSTGPANIIGTRYFEAMCTGRTIILSNIIDNLFDDVFENKKHFLGFKKVSEIKNLYEKYILNDENRNRLLNESRKNILENHTWKHRSTEVLKYLKDSI